MNTRAGHQILHSNRSISIVSACSVAGALAAFSSSAQNLLVNGSFEQEPIPSGQTSQFGVLGWEGMNSQDAIRVLANSSWGQLPAPLPDGNQAVTPFASGVIISQTLTFTEGTTLLFSIWDTANPRGGGTLDFESFATLSDGARPLTFDFSAGAQPGWQQHIWNVGAIEPGTYALQVYLNSNVAYDHASLVVVPEPGTMSLLGVGAVLLSARWWRRRRVS
jgi:hypothetical protein